MNTDEFSDAELIAAVESCALPLEKWHHRDHIRVAWVYLSREPFFAALDRLRATIKRFNAHHGVTDALESGYHETLTRAYLSIIDSTMRHYGTEADSRAFVERHGHLHRTLLRVFYSRPRIMSWEAKTSFVEPDLAPLPK